MSEVPPFYTPFPNSWKKKPFMSEVPPSTSEDTSLQVPLHTKNPPFIPRIPLFMSKVPPPLHTRGSQIHGKNPPSSCHRGPPTKHLISSFHASRPPFTPEPPSLYAKSSPFMSEALTFTSELPTFNARASQYHSKNPPSMLEVPPLNTRGPTFMSEVPPSYSIRGPPPWQESLTSCQTSPLAHSCTIIFSYQIQHWQGKKNRQNHLLNA